ncbi:serine-type endopeptidase [Curvularia clavata]|uniref:Serine-type endopeptidase n=1 Tax=Curvularia clavata TaxID=95742 RepID=A0A9Q9DVL7_CURCL|nr:serine-type endopeptidase [Curvularia clavata]
MGKLSCAIVALVLGAQVAIPTPVHPRLHSDVIVQRAADDKPVASGILPGAYIVEFANAKETPKTFYASLAASGVQVEPRKDLRFRFFKGVSFQLKSSSSNSSGWDFLRQMKAQPQVKNIWPTRITTRAREESAVVPAQLQHAKRQAVSQDTFSPHVMTQVDKLHAEGVTGKGYRVAIVDSGVDYTHPALGGCFGPGCLVEVGYDFVGDNYIVGKSEPKPDNDPMDNCVGHGTHVAGSIAAQLQGNEYGFTGSAPGAKLGAYRMWGCSATSTNEIELIAFARAVEDGADIISYSNGDASGWAQDVRAVIISRIVDSGIPVVVSEGNDGGQGLFYASSPATGSSITGTGAVSNTLFPTFLERGSYKTSANATTNGTHEFSFLMGVPEFTADTTLPLWSAADADDACKPLPDDTPDLSQRIVLLEFKDARATRCYPQDQGSNIAAKGGRFMLYYERTNLTMRDEPFVYAEGIEGVARVVPYAAEHWLTLLSQGATVTLTIPANGSQTHLEELDNKESGGYVAGQLTSWGPSWELSMTPQLVSPGENILSTFPTALGSYRVMTGTSMSTPLVAGIYAMLGEVYGKLEPKRLRRILTHTSKPLAWHDGKTAHPDILAPVAQQGAGIVQAWKAAHTTLEIDIDSIMLNDTEHFVSTHTFSVMNSGSADEVLELNHRKAVTLYTMDAQAAIPRPGLISNSIVNSWATVSFSSDRINVAAGQSVNVTVEIAPPTGLNATLLPVYSGFIALGDKLVLPYLGVVGNMRSATLLTPDNVYLAQGYAPAPGNASYTIPRPDPNNPPMADRGDTMATPNIYISPLVGSPLLRVEVLQGDKVLGPLAGFPQTYVARRELRAYFNGLLADGRVLDEGLYRMRVMALHIFGDEARKEDWDVVDSASFAVKYAT